MVRNLELRARWRREFITPDFLTNQMLSQLGGTWTVLEAIAERGPAFSLIRGSEVRVFMTNASILPKQRRATIDKVRIASDSVRSPSDSYWHVPHALNSVNSDTQPQTGDQRAAA